MYAFLRQHPDVFMSPLKEPCYFCTDFHDESDRLHGGRVFFPIRSTEKYLSLFREARDHAVVGEASPLYLCSSTAIQNIAKVRPDARILAILREPVDFLVSLHKQRVRNGYEDQTSLLDALNLEHARREGRHLPKDVPCARLLFYREWIRYWEHLARCFQHFPRERVKVVIYEDFRRDNKGVFREVAEWLGIDPTFQPTFREINKYPEGELSPLARWLYRPRLRALLRNLVPVRWYDAIWDFAFGVFWRPSPESKSDKEKIRDILDQEIKETIERTSEVLKRDLYSIWGKSGGQDKPEYGRPSATSGLLQVKG